MSTVYAVAPRPATLAVPLSSTPSYVNPAQMQTTQAGPSTQSPTAKKKPSESASAAKRKRTDTPEDSATDPSGQQPRKARDGPKKKKANRACFHCQKAHLTCDDCTYFFHSVQSASLSAFLFTSTSSTMSTLHQARHCEQLHRRSSQKG